MDSDGIEVAWEKASRRLTNQETGVRSVLLEPKIIIPVQKSNPPQTFMDFRNIRFWGSANDSNTNKIQAFHQNYALRRLSKAPLFVTNPTFHNGFPTNTTNEEARINRIKNNSAERGGGWNPRRITENKLKFTILFPSPRTLIAFIISLPCRFSYFSFPVPRRYPSVPRVRNRTFPGTPGRPRRRCSPYVKSIIIFCFFFFFFMFLPVFDETKSARLKYD